MAMPRFINYATFLSFIFSGIILNSLQLLIFLFIKPFNKDLFRRINHFLCFSTWSQTNAVADWGGNLELRVWYKDEETKQAFGKCTGLVIMNHRHDLDWLVPWQFTDRVNILGNGKAMLKASLRFVPAIGWGAMMSDMIFLYRDWKKDRERLEKTLDVLLTYPQSLILSFFEGTRFTQAKYEASVKFAKERGLPILKHHLLPRTRGFNSMMQHVHRRIKEDSSIKFDIYNMQCALRGLDGNENPSLLSVMHGEPAIAYLYVGRVKIDEVPVDTDEATSNFMYNLYKSKDDLAEYFKENGRFPGIEVKYKPRVASLVNWLGWMAFTYACIAHLLYKVLTSGNYVLILGLTIALAVLAIAIRVMIGTTEVSKSSSYGASTTTSKRSHRD